MKSPITQLRAVALVAALISCGALRADMGSVWVESVSENSITINWTDPKVRNRIATQIPIYTVSWQNAGSYPYPFPGSGVEGESHRFAGREGKPFVISGLLPDTSYSIRVDAYAEKQTIFGDWINPKDRLLGAVRQKTLSMGVGSLLRVAQTAEESITLELKNPDFRQFDKIRIAYKQKWSDVHLNETSSEAVGPDDKWEESNAVRGWHDELSTAGVARVTFSSLSPATSYEFVAHAFNIGHDLASKKLGSAMGRTAGYPQSVSLDECAARDHRSLLVNYAKTVGSAYGCGSVFQMCVAFDPDLEEAKSLALLDDGDQLEDNATALHFLISTRQATFESFQSEFSTRGGQAFGDFLGNLSPDLYARLQAEIDPPAPVFQRGDTDGNGRLEISDAIQVLLFLYSGAAKTRCEDAADANNNGEIDMADSVFLLSFLYSGGREPPPPHGFCGPDTPQNYVEDSLTCNEYSACPR